MGMGGGAQTRLSNFCCLGCRKNALFRHVRDKARSHFDGMDWVFDTLPCGWMLVVMMEELRRVFLTEFMFVASFQRKDL